MTRRRHIYPFYCPRCGHDCTEQRHSRFRDEDFIEVFHERMEYEVATRTYARAHRDTVKKLWHAETDADLWRHQAALYRAQLVAAGIEPLDATEKQPDNAVEAEALWAE